LAKSCLCPGFSTLVSNLITSSNFEVEEHIETWLQEYIQGMGKEMYRVKLSHSFEGKPFSQVANVIYECYHCTLFAVEIVDRQGRVRVVMSPAKYEIPSGATYGYLIANDVDEVSKVSRHGWTEQRETEHKDAEKPAAAFNPLKLNVGWEAEDFMSSRAEVEKMKLNFHYAEEPFDLDDAVKDQVEELTGHILLVGSPQSYAFFVETLRRKHVEHKDIVILTTERPTNETWHRIRHFPGVHFIIGNQNLRKDLVRAGIHGVDTAVIISSQSKAERKLRGKAETGRTKREIEIRNELKGGGRLMDSDCIFTYQAIRKHCPTAKIICQLRRAENILFLGTDLGRDNDISVTPYFASGVVFLSAMMDRLIAQCFYNRDLLNILEALISSCKFSKLDFSGDVEPAELGFQSVPRSFEGKTYMQLFKYLISKKSTLPLGLYRRSPLDDVSPQPYVITNPSPDLIISVQDSVFALLSPEAFLQAPLGEIFVVVVEAELPPRRSKASSVSCLVESEGESAQVPAQPNAQSNPLGRAFNQPVCEDALSILHIGHFKESILPCPGPGLLESCRARHCQWIFEAFVAHLHVLDAADAPLPASRLYKSFPVSLPSVPRDARAWASGRPCMHGPHFPTVPVTSALARHTSSFNRPAQLQIALAIIPMP